MQYRVTYAAAKRENVFRAQMVNGQPTGNLDLLDTRVSFHEEKTVLVDAESQEEAIQKATKHVPADAEISAQAHLLSSKRSAEATTVTEPPKAEAPAEAIVSDDDLEAAYQRAIKKKGK